MKVKHFLYRITTIVLSCRAILLTKREVQTQIECVLCQLRLEESRYHLFVSCNWVRAEWFAHPASIGADAIRVAFVYWLREIMDTMEA